MRELKLYVIRKYIKARSVADALKVEKRQDADDIWLDEGYKEQALKIGFQKNEK